MVPQLSIVPQRDDDQAPLSPLLKWVGSKRRLAPLIGRQARAALGRRGRYLEPFFGGGSVYFWMRPKRAVLSDVLPELVGVYKAITHSPAEVSKALQSLGKSGCTKESYLKVRDTFNKTHAQGGHSDPAQAARFLFINRRGFNGLWRTNKKGACNVPWGGERSESLPSSEEIHSISKALEGAELRHGDFEETLSTAGTGDVIYADPPYAGTFTGYAGGFSSEDQERLARALRSAAERGAVIFASNSNHPLIRKCYKDFLRSMLVEQYHAVGAKGERRRKVSELLLTNAEP